MESRTVLLLLAQAVVLAGLAGCGRHQLAKAEDTSQPPVIEPDVERRPIKVAKIDTENFEVGISAGELSIEDFGVNTVTGLRFAYHVSENFFLEAAGGKSTAGKTSFETLSGSAELLTDSEREYKYYNVSFGYNILPGEAFIGKNHAWNTSTYLIGGVGETTFAGDNRFTVNFGMGIRLIPLDWLAVHADVRDHIFDTDLLGVQKRTHNLELGIGVTFFF
jgi:outer membrane beta-barrel protein